MKTTLDAYIREYSVRNKNDENIPVFSVTNSQGFCQGYFGKEVASQDKTTYKIVPKGYFAYNPSRINVGSVDWLRNEDKVIVSPLYNVFSVDPRIDNQYLYYYLKSKVALQYIRLFANGSVRDNLKIEALKKIPINLPGIAEQRKIVGILDLASQIIRLRTKELQQFDTLIKARFVEMFGNPEINEKSLPVFPASKFLDVVGGYAFQSKNFRDEGIPVLRIGNINAGYFQPVNMVYWDDDSSLNRYKMFPGDLVMSLTGTVGKDDYGNVCILGEEYDCYFLNQRNAKLELHSGLNKYYLAEILKFPAIKKRLTGISRGIRQANISNRDILNMELPIPDIDQQNVFADFVHHVDKSKVAVQKSLDQTQLLMDSLMQQYFG